MSVPARVNIVTLGVADVARATAFYEALGWQRSSASMPEITFLLTTGCVVALFATHDLAEDVTLPATGAAHAGDFRGVTLAINLESTDQVDEVYAAWVAAGATPVKPPAAVSWGGYSSYVADPDGHAWELAHNPYFPFAEDGSIILPS
jgi:uncharacterized protein